MRGPRVRGNPVVPGVPVSPGRRAGRNRRGVTLVEMLMGVVVLSLAVLPLIKVFMSNVTGAEENWISYRASLAAQNLLQTMARTRWDQLGPAGTVPTASATIGLDVPGVYDDVDDWDGFSDVFENQFTRSVAVDFVAVVANTVVPTGGVPSDLKRVQVNISWTEGTHNVVFNKIFANSAL